MNVRPAERAQALIELALGLPLLVLLLVGAVDLSVLASDQLQGEHAVRQGARVAASLGGRLANAGTFDPRVAGAEAKRRAVLDLAVCNTVLATFKSLPMGALDEVDVYRPQRPDGSPTFGSIGGMSELNDMVFISGGKCQVISSGAHYTLDKRTDVPGREESVGVMAQWHFEPLPGADLGFRPVRQHATMKFPPAAP